MNPDGMKLLKLMFNEGETACVSPNQFGYHSMPIDSLSSDTITLVPTPESAEKRKMKWEDTYEQCSVEELQLLALNPIKGFRVDDKVTAYRSFLVELDDGGLAAQVQYVKDSGLPYTAMVFSGSKSIHTLITLDEDIPNYEMYYHYATWILSALPLADQKTKNPSRSIRIPGVIRKNKIDGLWVASDKQQKLIETRKRISFQELTAWLSLHPDAEPKKYEKRHRSDVPHIDSIKPWALRLLKEGINRDRNQKWFAVAFEFCLSGFDEDDTIETLSGFFVEDKDFKRKEFLTAIRSAFKRVREIRK